MSVYFAGRSRDKTATFPAIREAVRRGPLVAVTGRMTTVSPEDGGFFMSSPPKLSHESLHVYRAAIEFLVLASSLLERLPRGHGPIADQLRRAALSIPLNIAEGYGKRGRDDRARYYDIARGSAHECGAILDASIILHLVDEPTYHQGKTLLHRIVAMLVKMTA